MKKYYTNGKLRIYLNAVANIVHGEELRYDYGESDLPWRSHVSFDFNLIILLVVINGFGEMQEKGIEYLKFNTKSFYVNLSNDLIKI